MKNMFYKCSSLHEINLSNFKTQKVTNMKCMFSDCSSLNYLIIKLPQKKLFVKNLKKIYRKIKFHKFNNFPFLE